MRLTLCKYGHMGVYTAALARVSGECRGDAEIQQRGAVGLAGDVYRRDDGHHYELKRGRLSYELRRLRLHGIIERIAKSQRYRLTREGLRTTLFYARVHQRLLRPGLAILQGAPAETPHPLKAKLTQLETLIDAYTEKRLAA